MLQKLLFLLENVINKFYSITFTIFSSVYNIVVLVFTFSETLRRYFKFCPNRWYSLKLNVDKHIRDSSLCIVCLRLSGYSWHWLYANLFLACILKKAWKKVNCDIPWKFKPNHAYLLVQIYDSQDLNFLESQLIDFPQFTTFQFIMEAVVSFVICTNNERLFCSLQSCWLLIDHATFTAILSILFWRTWIFKNFCLLYYRKRKVEEKLKVLYCKSVQSTFKHDFSFMMNTIELVHNISWSGIHWHWP